MAIKASESQRRITNGNRGRCAGVARWRQVSEEVSEEVTEERVGGV